MCSTRRALDTSGGHFARIQWSHHHAAHLKWNVNCNGKVKHFKRECYANGATQEPVAFGIVFFFHSAQFSGESPNSFPVLGGPVHCSVTFSEADAWPRLKPSSAGTSVRGQLWSHIKLRRHSCLGRCVDGRFHFCGRMPECRSRRRGSCTNRFGKKPPGSSAEWLSASLCAHQPCACARSRPARRLPSKCCGLPSCPLGLACTPGGCDTELCPGAGTSFWQQVSPCLRLIF